MSGTVSTEKYETLRVRSILLVIDDMRLGAWLRSGEGIGWLAAGTNYTKLYRVPFFIFMACASCHCSFPFVVFVLFLFCFVLFCFCFVLFYFVFRPSSELLL